ncbi:MAG TPA: SDR family oxidoreductase [Actinomycetaceae bacterium]|nr:SDR family oxidoreductase [Actinomycetaceae bacterium]
MRKTWRERTELRGAVVLITGSGSGIGELMAVGAARRGARAVILWDIDEAAMGRVADRVAALGVQAVPMPVDVRDPEMVTGAAARVIEEFGSLDVLINNAGVVSGKYLLELSEDEIERTFEVNVLAHYRTVRAFLPAMLERDRGLIVTVSSAGGLVGVPRMTDYCGSKFAAVGFAESMRVELRRRGSNVGTLLVCPYFIGTGMFEGVATRVPVLLPIMRPQDVAERTLDSIESRRQRLVIPPFAQVILHIKGLPVPVVDALTELFGINATMDRFQGRKPSARPRSSQQRPDLRRSH